jgi:flavin-binding protein dodecin
MAESVYKVIELVGTSTESWEKAAAAAIERASKSLRDLRVAEVVEQDLVIDKGKVEAYRTKLEPNSLVYDLRWESIPAVADFLHSLGYWAAENTASPRRRDKAI